MCKCDLKQSQVVVIILRKEFKLVQWIFLSLKSWEPVVGWIILLLKKQNKIDINFSWHAILNRIRWGYNAMQYSWICHWSTWHIYSLTQIWFSLLCKHHNALLSLSHFMLFLKTTTWQYVKFSNFVLQYSNLSSIKYHFILMFILLWQFFSLWRNDQIGYCHFCISLKYIASNIVN